MSETCSQGRSDGASAQVIARSPIAPAPPVAVVAGWEVSTRCSTAELTVTDCTPLAKVLVRASHDGAVARVLAVPFGRATRDGTGALVVGSGPGEWLVLAGPGTALEAAERVGGLAAATEEFVTVLDLTHGRALIRLTGPRSAEVLAKVCAIDFSDAVTPDAAAFRSVVADLVTDLVRDDRDGVRSYLLHCERSSGQYLFDVLIDAGAEFGVDIDGFAGPGI